MPNKTKGIGNTNRIAIRDTAAKRANKEGRQQKIRMDSKRIRAKKGDREAERVKNKRSAKSSENGNVAPNRQTFPIPRQIRGQ